MKKRIDWINHRVFRNVLLSLKIKPSIFQLNNRLAFWSILGIFAFFYMVATVNAATIPPMPTNARVTPLDSSRIQVTWSYSATTHQGFYVSDGTQTKTVAAGARSYIWTGLAPNTYKCFNVAAYNSAGRSAGTLWACTTTLTIPPAPSNCSAVPLDSNRIHVAWAYSAGTHQGFYVTDGQQIKTIAAGARSYIWTGLAPNTYKCFAVAAYNTVGYSAWTPWACTVTPPAVPIPMPIVYLSQYKGQASQNVDCGPADVAMVVQYRNKRPGNLADDQFISQVRTNAGVNDYTSYTTFTHLETALAYYGLSYSEIPASLTPQPDAQIQAMKNATTAGYPVIALIHGATIGRGEEYLDHWVIVTGFSADGQTVYLNDPDNQNARWPGWIVGGQITLPIATFSSAAYNAAPGPYGIIIY